MCCSQALHACMVMMQVCSGSTGHAEAVQLIYDPKTVSYETLCESFFNGHDATTKNRQGGDVGTQYRSAIFYHSDEQKRVSCLLPPGSKLSI